MDYKLKFWIFAQVHKLYLITRIVVELFDSDSTWEYIENEFQTS